VQSFSFHKLLKPAIRRRTCGFLWLCAPNISKQSRCGGAKLVIGRNVPSLGGVLGTHIPLWPAGPTGAEDLQTHSARLAIRKLTSLWKSASLSSGLCKNVNINLGRIAWGGALHNCPRTTHVFRGKCTKRGPTTYLMKYREQEQRAKGLE